MFRRKTCKRIAYILNSIDEEIEFRDDTKGLQLLRDYWETYAYVKYGDCVFELLNRYSEQLKASEEDS